MSSSDKTQDKVGPAPFRRTFTANLRPRQDCVGTDSPPRLQCDWVKHYLAPFLSGSPVLAAFHGRDLVHPALVKLQLQAEDRGVVSIKGVCANRYLAMKEDGRLLASKCVTDECFFFERLESNNYNTYRSRKYSSWYVALKRTGQYKLGSKTGPGQKAILFLPMSAKS
ncbi:fibroblast growth factor 2 [Ictidomys tridecemlineatus]